MPLRSSTITVDPKTGRYPPIHPGEMLWEEFMEPLGISAYRLAKDIGVPLSRISSILNGRRSLTADTALRLARYFRMTPQFWINMQSYYDLQVAVNDLGDRLEREVKQRPDTSEAA